MTHSLTLAAGAHAFGDSTHPSTRLMLEALEALAPNLAGEASPQAVCDMGAGSGILALRAAQLWPDALVVAAELERAAVEVIKENARANNIPLLPLHSDGFRHGEIAAHAPYDLIFMNILPDIILRLLVDAVEHLAEGGVLLMAGILEHRQEQIIEATQELGLELSYRLRLDGWVALVWQKGA